MEGRRVGGTEIQQHKLQKHHVMACSNVETEIRQVKKIIRSLEKTLGILSPSID